MRKRGSFHLYRVEIFGSAGPASTPPACSPSSGWDLATSGSAAEEAVLWTFPGVTSERVKPVYHFIRLGFDWLLCIMAEHQSLFEWRRWSVLLRYMPLITLTWQEKGVQKLSVWEKNPKHYLLRGPFCALSAFLIWECLLAALVRGLGCDSWWLYSLVSSNLFS